MPFDYKFDTNFRRIESSNSFRTFSAGLAPDKVMHVSSTENSETFLILLGDVFGNIIKSGEFTIFVAGPNAGKIIKEK